VFSGVPILVRFLVDKTLHHVASYLWRNTPFLMPRDGWEFIERRFIGGLSRAWCRNPSPKMLPVRDFGIGQTQISPKLKSTSV
jgi:hypothetical protein